MHWNLARSLILPLCLFCCAGCGGSPPSSQSATNAPLPGLPSLPSPSGVLRGVNFADGSRFLQATAFAAALPNAGVAVDGAGLRFSADWDPAGGMHEPAYAGYEWDLEGYNGAAELGLEWTEAPAAGVEVWAAVANWQSNRWVWRKVNAAGVKADLSSTGFVKDDGRILALVAVLAPAAGPQPLLSRVFIGTVATVVPGDATFTVDLAGPGAPISPFVYGTGEIDSAEAPAAMPSLVRYGGNRWTAYNWENNASNAGSDWHLPERRLPRRRQHARRGRAADAAGRVRCRRCGAGHRAHPGLRRGGQERRRRRRGLRAELPRHPLQQGTPPRAPPSP